MAASRVIGSYVLVAVTGCLLVASLLAGCFVTPALADDWYAPPVVTPAATGLFEVYPGDLNKDGITDAVAHAYSPDRLIIYWGSPNGRMMEVQEFPLWHTDHLSRQRVAIVDQDGDGWMDILENCNPG